MLAYVVNEGRLFALKPSEWSMLLGGVTLCGLLTLLLGNLAAPPELAQFGVPASSGERPPANGDQLTAHQTVPAIPHTTATVDPYKIAIVSAPCSGELPMRNSQ